MSSMAIAPHIRNRLLLIRLMVTFALIHACIAAPALWQQSVRATVIAPSLALAACLVVLSAIDWLTLRLPDLITLPLLALGLALAAARSPGDLVWHAGSALAGAACLYAAANLHRHWRGRDGLGLGDVKLFAAAGVWVGANGLPSVLLIACLAALAAVLCWQARGRTVGPQTAIPFGPFIALGLWVVWLYGPLA